MPRIIDSSELEDAVIAVVKSVRRTMELEVVPCTTLMLGSQFAAYNQQPIVDRFKAEGGLGILPIFWGPLQGEIGDELRIR